MMAAALATRWVGRKAIERGIVGDVARILGTMLRSSGASSCKISPRRS